jgi:hypothetical protein
MILFFFLHPGSQVRASMPYSFFLDPSVHPPAALTLRCAVWGLWFDNVCSRMRVRGPVHGMQGVLGKTEVKEQREPKGKRCRDTGSSKEF